MSFDAKITQWPTPFDATKGALVAQAYARSGPLYDLIAGAAGCSGYLQGLLLREVDWITGALEAPQAALSALLTDALGPADLRRAKGRMAALVALMDLGGVWTLEEVTAALTEFADGAVDLALVWAMAPLIARGKLPARTGLTVLAMGKMGAHELNYSSDIDLICLFDPAGQDPDTLGDTRAYLIRAVRAGMKTLSDVTADGYVFRTDLRLRPDAAVTPVVITTTQALDYYEGMGRTWERAAFIKARAAAGDIAAGDRFLDSLTPFVWRKHLDFAAIEDAHSIRLKIREHKGLHGPISLQGHDMKLGRGGIREIEFFAQTRQLISGGRDAALRQRATVPALRALAKAGWVAGDEADTLTAIYRRHRTVEHRLQMLRDAQTHSLPSTAEGVAQIAAFMGMAQADLEAQLHDDLTCVHELTEPFFAPEQTSGFIEFPASDFGAEITSRWPSYAALRSDRAVDLFDRLRPRILTRLQQAADPDQALRDFDGFLAGLPAGVQVFSLFDANPQLIDLLTDTASIAPPLASYLGRNPSVLDGVLDGAFFAAWPGQDALAQRFSGVLAQNEDYERALDALRATMQEWHFRIGVHLMRGLINGETAGHQYSDLARAVLRAVWPRVCDHFASRHGPLPGAGAVVLGMGSLGAGRLHARSDLDLMLIYDGQGIETSAGPRPLATRAYYIRLTQALITALSAPMSRGRLYEVDMRLRPSGRSGPVATSIESFEEYQRTQAWTWEHLAMTRACPVAGTETLSHRLNAFRSDLIAAPRDLSKTATDLAAMRDRLAEAKPGQGGLSAKDGPGRLQDIDLFAQGLALLSGAAPRATGDQINHAVASQWMDAAGGQDLIQTGRLLWQVRAAVELIGAPGQTVGDLGIGALQLLLRDTGADSREDLLERIDQGAKRCAAIIDQRIAKWRMEGMQ